MAYSATFQENVREMSGFCLRLVVFDLFNVWAVRYSLPWARYSSSPARLKSVGSRTPLQLPPLSTYSLQDPGLNFESFRYKGRPGDFNGR